MPALGPEWIVFEGLCGEKRLRGGIVADAWIAVPENRVEEPRIRYLALAA